MANPDYSSPASFANTAARAHSSTNLFERGSTTKALLTMLGLSLLAGCVSPPYAYETKPVKIASAKGDVTCQFYTTDYVVWDRAIDLPASMTVAEADAICFEAGKRRKRK